MTRTITPKKPRSILANAGIGNIPATGRSRVTFCLA